MEILDIIFHHSSLDIEEKILLPSKRSDICHWHHFSYNEYHQWPYREKHGTTTFPPWQWRPDLQHLYCSLQRHGFQQSPFMLAVSDSYTLTFPDWFPIYAEPLQTGSSAHWHSISSCPRFTRILMIVTDVSSPRQQNGEEKENQWWCDGKTVDGIEGGRWCGWHRRLSPT